MVLKLKLSRSAFYSINLASSANHKAEADAKPTAPKGVFLNVPATTTRAAESDTTPAKAASPVLSSPDAADAPFSVSSPFLTDATLAAPSSNTSSATLVSADPALVRIGEFAPVRLLGEGGFGRVYHVVDRTTGRPYALKVVPKSTLKHASAKLVRREQRVLRALAGEQAFLPLHASWHDTENFYLATEYYPAGDLRAAMRRAKRFNPLAAKFYTAELLLALETLHSAGIVHRDVKPENILVDAEGHLVLADFGLAKMFKFGKRVVTNASPASGELGKKGAEFTKSACGTLRYMAPETLMGKPYSYGVDLWAVGVILYMMLFGHCPYGKNIPKKEFKEAVLKQPLTFRPGVLDAVTQDFLEKLLTKDPEARPSIAEVKKHPYFANVDWVALGARKLRAPRLPSIRTSKIVTPDEPITIGAGATSYGASDDPYPEFTFMSYDFRDGKAGISIKYLEAPTPTAELEPLAITLSPRVDSPLSVPSPHREDQARWRLKVFFLRVFQQRAEEKALAARPGPAANTAVDVNVCGFSEWTSVGPRSMLDALAQVDVDHNESSGSFNVLERLKWWFRRQRVQAVRHEGSRGLDLDC
ncbi:kinase-like protein [Artomyces pyxidatus]|uniref:Kinase-like protein n=1 Tax=Artomyces pyxidatus TaxID=48021 RepID=A0ACB8T451_9AGAM|nr:kinase-like protein [Artomyces pyxidatus]